MNLRYFLEYVRSVPTNGRYLPVMAPDGVIYIVTPANELACDPDGAPLTYPDFAPAWDATRAMGFPAGGVIVAVSPRPPFAKNRDRRSKLGVTA
jgi:hypothetical protein